MNEIESLGEYHLDRNAFLLGGEPMVFHCHHYNCFLQLSLEQTSQYIDVHTILVESAQEVVYSQLNQLFESIRETESRKSIAGKLFSYCGFGVLDFSQLTEKGGFVSTQYEHYGIGWADKFGKRSPELKGVGFFTSGYISGALEAIYDLPIGTLETKQTRCLSKGEPESVFVTSRRSLRKILNDSPGEGIYQQFDQFENDPSSNIDYVGIRDALINMPLYGDHTGMIHSFDVLLTRHFANYYNLISMRVLLEMEKLYGLEGIMIVRELLVEAGHVCAFNTFGGIMLSAEWDALVAPMIQCKEDWVHGIVACVNALGWGKLTIEKLTPQEETTFEIVSSYESNAILKIIGQTEQPVSFLFEGGIAGILNLVYHGDISTRPLLDESYYRQLVKKEGRFKTTKYSKCRTFGDKLDRFQVERA